METLTDIKLQRRAFKLWDKFTEVKYEGLVPKSLIYFLYDCFGGSGSEIYQKWAIERRDI